MRNLKQGGTLLLLALLGIPLPLRAASGPFEIDIKELDKQKPPAQSKQEKKKAPKAKKKKPVEKAGREHKGERTASEYARYTVKPGDHIFKILMVRFGMSNDEAESLIPEIIRINKISDIRKLKVGETLLIPSRTKRAAKEAPPSKQREQEAEAALKIASSLEQGATAPVAAPEPAPTATPPAVPPVPSVATAPATPAPAAVWVCSVPDKEVGTIVDSVLNALSISWTRNRIIRSEEGAPNPYSIRVDRYFEHRGERYIVTLGETDPYSYTLIRILESAGYRSLMLKGTEDFSTVAQKLLGLIGVVSDLGKHPWQEGKDITGFLIQPDNAGGRRVVITDERVDPRGKWVMKPGCLVK